MIRTAKALGYSGLDDLRRALVAELRLDLSLPARLARTLGEVGENLETALDLTLDIQPQPVGEHHWDTAA